MSLISLFAQEDMDVIFCVGWSFHLLFLCFSDLLKPSDFLVCLPFELSKLDSFC